MVSYSTVISSDNTVTPNKAEVSLIIRKNHKIIHTQHFEADHLEFTYDPKSECGTAGEISWTSSEVKFDSKVYPFDESLRDVLVFWKYWKVNTILNFE